MPTILLILITFLSSNVYSMDIEKISIQINKRPQKEKSLPLLIRNHSVEVEKITVPDIPGVNSYLRNLKDNSTYMLGGDREGNGGVSSLARFNILISKFLWRVNQLDNNSIDSTLLKSLLALDRKVFVYCSSNLILRGQRVDAINYYRNGIPVIKLDCKKIDSLSDAALLSLVAHELVYLAGYDDSKYNLSRDILLHLEKTHVETSLGDKIVIFDLIYACSVKKLEEYLSNHPKVTLDFRHESPLVDINVMESALLNRCHEAIDVLLRHGYTPSRASHSSNLVIQEAILLSKYFYNIEDDESGDLYKSYYTKLLDRFPWLLDEKFDTCSTSNYSIEFDTIFKSRNCEVLTTRELALNY
jgi:hypothetical protein